MAVILKKKDVGPPKEEPSQRELSAMAEAGLLPAVPSSSITTKHKALIVGGKVIVNHSLFPWMTNRVRGAVGVVKAVFPAKDKHIVDAKDYDTVVVATDGGDVSFSRWELDVV